MKRISFKRLFANATAGYGNKSFLRFEAAKSKKSVPKNSVLRAEALEDRALLSVAPEGALLDAPIYERQDLQVLQAPVIATTPIMFDLEANVEKSNGIEESPVAYTINDSLIDLNVNPQALTKDFVFNLSSNPESTYTIYLDFNGHTTTGTSWNSKYGTIVTPAYDTDGNSSVFSQSELHDIYEIWFRVSEDYAPFDVNVTTVEPTSDQLIKTDKSDVEYGIRCCIGGSCNDWYSSAGGVGYVGSFTWDSDTPCFVFKESGYGSGAAASAAHEVGHTLGLIHDGIINADDSETEYYDGTDVWGPIMGSGYYSELTQWSKGEYAGANNSEDDLAIITSKSNGFGYKADDHSDLLANATPFELKSSGTLASGVIETNEDLDYFSFVNSGDAEVLYIGGVSGVTNLDVAVSLYDDGGNLVKTYDPSKSLYVLVDLSELKTGATYCFSVSGTGLTVGGTRHYTDYASLGSYLIIAKQNDDPTSDRFEPNNSSVSAGNLGFVNAKVSYDSLKLGNDYDYYKFEIGAPGTSENYVRTEYNKTDDRVMYLGLYDSKQNLIDYCFFGNTDWQQVDLDRLEAGTYFIKIYNYYDLEEPYDYTLTINAPSAKVPTYKLTTLDVANTPKVGSTLQAVLQYEDATANYQWYYADSANSTTWISIQGANDASFAPTAQYVGKYLKVVATGTGAYVGTVEAVADSPVVNQSKSITTWTVTSTADSETTVGTLRYALANASDGATITFDASLKNATITLDGAELEIRKSITIDASALYDATTNTPGITINANRKSRVFMIDAYVSAQLIGLTITGGKTDGIGGGVYVDSNGSFTSTNSAIFGNSAIEDGGGVCVGSNGTFTATNSTIEGNSATWGGGVIVWGTFTSTNSAISDNSAIGGGGGVYVDGTFTSMDSTISNNSVKINGGGVYVDSYGTFTSTNSTIIGNSADDGGGGIYVDGTFTSTDSAIIGNSANWGGGVFLNFNGNFTSTNSVIAVNSTVNSGGGVYLNGTFTSIGSTIVENYATWGGGVYSNGTFTSTDSTIGYNSAPRGGGVCVSPDGSLTLTNSTIEGNYASYGGGVYVYASGTFASTNSTIEGNYADQSGGGVYVSGTFTATNSTIEGNYADQSGGGVFVASDGSFTSKYSTIGKNSAVESGGGVYLNGTFTSIGSDIEENSANRGGGVYLNGTFTSIGSTIVENSATWGGGVYSNGTFTSTISKITGNSSVNSGGGIYVKGSFTSTNSTIAGNSANNGGGAYVDSNGSFTSTNSTIAGNSARTNGGGVCVNGTLTSTNSIWSLNYGVNIAGALSSSSKNNLIDVDPLFECAPEFDVNGVLLNGDSLDLRLRDNSPAINKGDNQSAYDAGLTVDSVDMAGNPRFVGSLIDIGAYEYNEKKPFDPTVVDTLNDSFDPNDGEWSLREAIYYANDYVTITFAEKLSGTIKLTRGELVVDKALAINGDGRIVIDAGGKSRVAYISAGTTDAPVLFNGLTLQNGVEYYGGGIYALGTLDVVDCMIVSNEAGVGGGIYAAGITTIEGSTFANNVAISNGIQLGGGALYNYHSTVTIKNSTFDSNSANDDGGAVMSSYGNLIVEDSEFVNNATTDAGGAIAEDYGTLVLSGSSLRNNRASGDGGAVEIYLSQYAEITDCDITENVSSANGGGIVADNGNSTISLLDCLIDSNEATYGGGICVYSGSVTSTNLTIVENYAVESGGGVSVNGSFTSTDSTIARNYADDGGGGIYLNGTFTSTDSTIEGNSANWGGGVFITYSGNFTSTNSVIAGNSTVNSGGGVYLNGTFTSIGSTIEDNSANWGGGVYAYGTFTSTDATIEGNSATYGGGVCVEGTFISTDTTIEGNSATYGGGVYAYGTFTSTDTTIEGNSAVESGGGVCVEGTFISTDTTIEGNSATYGGGVYTDGSFTSTNSTIDDNSASYGGGVFVEENGTFTSTSSTIVGNSSVNSGGGVYLNGSFTSIDSTIVENSANWGGGVYAYGTFTSTDATIAGNSANWGGGVYVEGTFTSTNSTIAGNSANWGGGVYVEGTFTSTNTILSLNYGANLDGGLSSSSKNNLIGADPLFVCAPEFDVDGVLLNGDSLDLRLRDDSPAIDKGDNQSAYDAGLTVDSTDLAGVPRFVGSAIDIGAYEYQPSAPTVVVDTLNDSFDPNDGKLSLREAIANATEYVTITFADNLRGTLTLTRGELVFDKALAIDGDGRIVIDAGEKSRVAYVSAGTTDAPVLFNGLTLQNGKADDGGAVYVKNGVFAATNSTISSSSATHGGAVYVNKNGTFTATNLTLSDNSGTYGAGAYVYNGGAFTATDSTISNNSAKSNGGAVYVYNSGSFTATDSIISDNSAKSNGGGVYVYNGGDFTSTDSTISNNSSKTGGGVYLGSGTFTATNTMIDDNLATSTGGGVYVYVNGVFTATDSKISDNSSEYGGGVYVGGTFTASNSTLSGNSATRGAGAYVYQNGSFVASDSTINENSATYGGGVYVYDDGGFISKNRSTIFGNSATKGGGVYVYNGGDFTSTDSRIFSNSAKNLGGGVCLCSFGTLTTINTTIDDNSALGGGGVYVYNDGVFTATDTTFDGNWGSGKSTSYGGGVYVGGTFIATNSTFALNSATMGGAVYVYQSGDFTATDTTVDGNSADYGGGVYVCGAFVASNLTLSNNSSSHGGGAYVYQNGSFTATDSIVVGNYSPYGGGVYVYKDGDFTATNSAFFGNSSTKGGGIYVYNGGDATVTNLTISGNSASNGGGVYLYSGGAFTAANSILSLNYGSDLSGKLSALSTNNLIGVDPSFVCAPEFNKSGVLLNVDSLDLRLRNDSSAVDKGDDQSARDAGLTVDSVDLAGKSRFVGAAIDIGAYEYQSSAAASALRQNMQIREIPEELADAELISSAFEDSDFDLFEEDEDALGFVQEFNSTLDELETFEENYFA